MLLKSRIADGRLMLLELAMLFMLDWRETVGMSTLRMKTFSGGSGLTAGVAILTGKRFGWGDTGRVEVRSRPYVANGAQYSALSSRLACKVDGCVNIGSKPFFEEKQASILAFSEQMIVFTLFCRAEPASVLAMKGCRPGRHAVMTDRFCAIWTQRTVCQ